ncbi:MAG: glycoside hydrolase family 16 protein [Tunicatimonas sp.]
MNAFLNSLRLLLLVGLVACRSNDQSASEASVPTLSDTQWELVWSDEFDYEGAPDPNKWGYEQGFIRNDELQYYTNRPENVRVDGDHLVIEARRDSAVVDGETREITSASVTTRGKQSWQYGKVEISAKLPNGLGTWPALWMLGENIADAGWPRCGEIDIMENVGYNADTVFTTIHTEAYNHTRGTQKIEGTYLPSGDDEFHTYGVEWNTQQIDFFIDDDRVFTVTKQTGDGVEEWPFDQPFFLLMNFAFGGAWGGVQGVDKNVLPQQYLIDYVRVYQAKAE